MRSRVDRKNAHHKKKKEEETGNGVWCWRSTGLSIVIHFAMCTSIKSLCPTPETKEMPHASHTLIITTVTVIIIVQPLDS